jgi:hypothetical protein
MRIVIPFVGAARRGLRVAALTVSVLLVSPTFEDSAAAQSKECKPRYALPKTVAGCFELARFGSGVVTVWLVRPNGDLQHWWLGPRKRARIPGAIAVADQHAYVFIAGYRDPGGMKTARLRVYTDGKTTERVIATYPPNAPLIPQISSSGQEGAISPNKASVALTLMDPAYREGDDKRRAVHVMNLSTKQSWQVEALGYQELRWDSDTILRIGTRTFNTETGTIQ